MFVGLLLYMGQKQSTAEMYFTPKLYVESLGILVCTATKMD